MPLPRISLVTPSYNQAAYLEQAIESVLSQGYPDLEYQVLDGGSSDASAEIIRRHAGRLHRWRSASDQGQAATLAEGFAQATGEVLGWLNSDDYLEPGTLQAIGEAFAANPDADIVYGDLRTVDQGGRRLFHSHLVLDLRILAVESPYVAQQAMFWRRSIYQRAGGIDPSYRFAMDFDLVVRMLLAGARSLKLRRVLANFRLHPESKSSHLLAVCDAEVERTRARHGLGRGGPVSRTIRRWGARTMRFARDPRGIWSAIESRVRPIP
jgi:glycosyltransferase involved in cell wall biosynthesis